MERAWRGHTSVVVAVGFGDCSVFKQHMDTLQAAPSTSLPHTRALLLQPSLSKEATTSLLSRLQPSALSKNAPSVGGAGARSRSACAAAFFALLALLPLLLLLTLLCRGRLVELLLRARRRPRLTLLLLRRPCERAPPSPGRTASAPLPHHRRPRSSMPLARPPPLPSPSPSRGRRRALLSRLVRAHAAARSRSSSTLAVAD